MTDNTNTPVAGENTDQTVDTGTPIPQDAGRTFTQDDVNRIVQERLAKERSKLNPPPPTEKELELAEREKALIQREFEQSARAILKERELPDEILTVLNVSDADGLKCALDILDDIFDYSNKDAGIYYQDEDIKGTRLWRKYRNGDPRIARMAVASAGTGTASMYGTGYDDPVREGMGLNKKE